MNYFFRIGLLAFTMCWFQMGDAFAGLRDSIVSVKVDPASVPKNATIIRLSEEKKGLHPNDTARIMMKTLADVSEKPKTVANLNVNKSLYGNHTDFIVDYVKNYHANHGARLDRLNARSKGYFKMMDNVLKRYNMPRELKSLAVIESAMNSNAVSPVGAVGPWQFMEGTARHMGLRVDGRIDERRDFYKSTHAAAQYMRYLYDIFGDWLLVIASYNCGPTPVLRAINAGNGESFWDIKTRLPKETQNHVMAFIATTSYLDKQSNVLAMGNVPKGAKAPKADFSNLSTGFAMNEDAALEPLVEKPKFSKEELDQMAVLKVKGAYKLNAISRVLDEDIVRLRRWNPDFDTQVTDSSEPVKLRIPMQKLEQFIVSKDRIMAESKKG
jgi:membrane-bound lytic murein transglycosylase D